MNRDRGGYRMTDSRPYGGRDRGGLAVDIARHEGGPLSQEEQRILQALLSSPTKAAAAEALGISRATLYRRLLDEDLKAAYETMRAEAIADAKDSLLTVAESAVGVLHAIAQDPDTPAQTRVTAAAKVLDLALKAHELNDVVSRIEELERAAY